MPGPRSRVENGIRVERGEAVLLKNMRLIAISLAAVLLTFVILRSKNTPHEAIASMQSKTVPVRLLGKDGKPTEVQTVDRIVKTDDEWRKQLTPEQFEIARGKGTEGAFCGAFYDHKKPGIYACICCDLPLFAANAKFDSGTGWPSFFQPLDKTHVREISDGSAGMSRVEVECRRCGGHLGHVFDDGPKPTGLRYCMNSVSLSFVEQ